MQEHNGNDWDVGWLSSWHVVTATCGRCHRRVQLDIDAIMRRHPGIGLISAIAPRLVCRGCGNRDGNQVTLSKLPRNL